MPTGCCNITDRPKDFIFDQGAFHVKKLKTLTLKDEQYCFCIQNLNIKSEKSAYKSNMFNQN